MSADKGFFSLKGKFMSAVIGGGGTVAFFHVAMGVTGHDVSNYTGPALIMAAFGAAQGFTSAYVRDKKEQEQAKAQTEARRPSEGPGW